MSINHTEIISINYTTKSKVMTQIKSDTLDKRVRDWGMGLITTSVKNIFF